MPIRDQLQRPLRSLRVSVTDRCNLRCGYCMPERDYVWLPRDHLLTYRELTILAAVFADLGVRRLRLTGGEPLVRSDLAVLVRQLAVVPGLQDLALTTNGVLLGAQAEALAAAGLARVTISLDSLRPDRFRELTGRGELATVLAGIDRWRDARGAAALKTNMVVMRGVNDDEIEAMLEFGAQVDAEVRFIEYMDVGGATRWSLAEVFPRDAILQRIEARFGAVTPIEGRGSAPAARFALPSGQVFGVIASTTAPFCGSCDRARLTADGVLYLCLYAKRGLDLRAALRGGATAGQLAEQIAVAWNRRDDRGAEQRLAMAARAPLAGVAELRADPHLEMHTRGG